ncbi:MAG: thiamine pyrophosphate-binding protein, partial [Streptosporangiaceae bacterium]
MRVAEAVGLGLAKLGADTVFGVVGSGNFHVTNALIAGGARFVAARHEGGATVMADAWARTTGRPGVVSVHQGPGLTNAMTGIAEAAKSRTPLLVLAAEAPEIRSNFHVDVAGLAAAVGAVSERIYSPASALADVQRAYTTALGRRTVILALPLNVQAAPVVQHGEADPSRRGVPGGSGGVEPSRGQGQSSPLAYRAQAAPRTYPAGPASDAVTAIAAVLRGSDQPVFIAGRG